MNDVTGLMPIADFTSSLEPMARDVCHLFNVDPDELFHVEGSHPTVLFGWQLVAHRILMGYLAHVPKRSLPQQVRDKLRNAGIDLILSRVPAARYSERQGVAV